MKRPPFPSAPPVAHTPRPWSFPDTRRVRLPWGLEVATARMTALPLVQVRWTFSGGRVLEHPAPAGAGRLIGAVSRHGTAAYDSAGLALALDHLGARLRVSVSRDLSSVVLTALAEHLDQALDLCDEVAFRPTFPADALDRERRSALEGLRHQQRQPDAVASEWLSWLVFGEHPYGRPGLTAAGLAAADHERVVALHGRLFDPSSAMLAVVGDLDPEALACRLADRYAAPPLAPAAESAAPLEPAPTGAPRRIVVVDRPHSEQAAIAVGHALFARSHPDYLVMRVVNQVVGGGASARLFHELRERRSLTYGVYSALDAGVAGGELSAQLSCSPDKAREAVSALLSELERAAAEPVAEDELEDARRYLIGSFPQKASGVSGVSSLLATAWRYGLPSDVWSSYQAAVAGVTGERAAEVASRWIRPSEASLVVVGPGDDLASALAQIGPVERRQLDERDYD